MQILMQLLACDACDVYMIGGCMFVPGWNIEHFVHLIGVICVTRLKSSSHHPGSAMCSVLSYGTAQRMQPWTTDDVRMHAYIGCDRRRTSTRLVMPMPFLFDSAWGTCMFSRKK